MPSPQSLRLYPEGGGGAGMMRRMTMMTKEEEEEEMMTEEEFPACGPRPSAGATQLLTSTRVMSIPPHRTLT